jgi:hypothetical protein
MRQPLSLSLLLIALAVLAAAGACSGILEPGSTDAITADASTGSDLLSHGTDAPLGPPVDATGEVAPADHAIVVGPDGALPDQTLPDQTLPLDQAPPPDQAAPDPKQRFGINIDPANPAGNPTAQQLKLAGVRWVRIEWKSSQGYALYDPAIAALRAAKLKVLLLVDYASVPGKPASDAASSEWTSYLQTFDSGLDAIAAHYADGVDGWQVWNEPDLPKQPGYDPGVPADQYGKLLLAAVGTIHKHSTRPVITGGLASGNPGYLTQAKQSAGALTVDAVAVHPYGQRAPDNWPSASWGFGNMSTLLNAYLAFGKPIWLSEIGTNDTSSATFQADYLENVYTLAKNSFGAKVPVVLWFCWSDGMVSPYGLLDGSGQPKPAYTRYQSIAGSW